MPQMLAAVVVGCNGCSDWDERLVALQHVGWSEKDAAHVYAACARASLLETAARSKDAGGKMEAPSMREAQFFRWKKHAGHAEWRGQLPSRADGAMEVIWRK